ncbi:uncharacterized protein LOC111613291 [Centruroides sculpturatus]|uniref:uncharacterized protein LOC111613291 n=1 Tax=Centruroides sculpturatus TaxID=218467 RepID=UPI000C6D5734|nr:uncharacterized protein LOC111613291 [Centruroides sculpturatus]
MLKSRSDIIFNHLARVAKADWGLDSAAIKEIYRAVFIPKVTYAASVWHAAVDKVRNKRTLMTIQRHAALRLAKAFRTISTDALLVICGVMPLDLAIHEKAQHYRVRKGKTIRVGNDTFMMGSYCVKPTLSELYSPPERLIITEIDENIDGSIELYTDGSKSDKGVGAAFVVYVEGAERAFMQFKLDNNCTVFQAKLLALKEAVRYFVESLQDEQVTICTDSRTALDTLKQYKDDNKMAIDIKGMLKRCQGRGVIKFRWVKAHAGLVRNERADALAKDAADNESTDFNILPRAYIKKKIRDSMRKRWQVRWSDSTKGRNTYEILPNIEERLGELKWMSIDFVMTQMLSGHAKCNAYLHKINKHPNDRCECGADCQSIQHLIFQCSKYALLRHEMECVFMFNQPNTTMNLYHIIRNKDVYAEFRRLIGVIFKRTFGNRSYF